MAVKSILAGLVALASAAPVQAAPVALFTSVNVGSNLSMGQTSHLQVDVNSLLAGAGMNANAILGGVLTVFGHSSASYLPLPLGYADTGYQVTGAASHSFLGFPIFDTISTNYRTWTYKDLVADTMLVFAGDSLGADAVGKQESYTGYGNQSYAGRTGSYFGGYDYRYTRDRNHYDALSGDLAANLGLDGKALADLMQDGLLNLSVNAFLGHFTISSIRLDLTLEALPDEPSGGQVPVPGSLLLTGLGLAALAAARRRKQ